MFVFSATCPPAFAIYIPHWLDSMSATTLKLLMKFDIYIPHWLDSMFSSKQSNSTSGNIYIPHWLDSMRPTCVAVFPFFLFTFHTG